MSEQPRLLDQAAQQPKADACPPISDWLRRTAKHNQDVARWLFGLAVVLQVPVAAIVLHAGRRQSPLAFLSLVFIAAGIAALIGSRRFRQRCAELQILASAPSLVAASWVRYRLVAAGHQALGSPPRFDCCLRYHHPQAGWREVSVIAALPEHADFRPPRTLDAAQVALLPPVTLVISEDHPDIAAQAVEDAKRRLCIA